MKYINATKIHKETGVGYELIRKLTRQNYLQPVNSEPPYMYTEDAIQMVLDYKYSVDGSVSLKHLDKRDEEILSTLKDILNRLTSMEQKLNTPQMPQMFYSPQGIQKFSDPDKEHRTELKERLEVLKKGRFRDLSIENVKCHRYRYATKDVEEMLDIHEELTGDIKPRERYQYYMDQFAVVSEEFKGVYQQCVKDKSEFAMNNFKNTKLEPLRTKFIDFIKTTFDIRPPHGKGVDVIFDTPYEKARDEYLDSLEKQES